MFDLKIAVGARHKLDKREFFCMCVLHFSDYFAFTSEVFV